MDKKEAIEKVKTMTVETFFSGTLFVKQQEVIAIIEQIGEPTSGCAEEAPRHLRNILARLRGLPEHDREVWLNGIMSEFEQDFGHVKWRDGYEQGKFEGMFGCEKVKIPQFVADIIEEYKDKGAPIIDIFTEKYSNEEYNTWLVNELNAYDRAARAWLDGYEVEKEKTYTARLKLVTLDSDAYLNKDCTADELFISGLDTRGGDYQIHFKQTELEELDIWDNPAFEIEEVE